MVALVFASPPTCPLMVKARDCHLVGKFMVLARGVDIIPSRLFILEYHLSIGGRIHLTCSMGKKPGSNGSRPPCYSVRNMGICTHDVQCQTTFSPRKYAPCCNMREVSYSVRGSLITQRIILWATEYVYRQSSQTFGCCPDSGC